MKMGLTAVKFEPIPVTPTMITWARERAGYSLDLAKKDFKFIEEWEDGQKSPTYPQLEKMGEKFKIPIALFFFPEPPDTPSISESFRTIPEEDFSRLPPRVRLLLRKAKAFQISLEELSGDINSASRKIVKDIEFSTKASIVENAKIVREYLGVSLQEQMDWGSSDEGMKSWRNAFHDVGVFVFKDQFRVEGYSGFCLYDEEFPVIYVNNSTAKTRQIFTLFHELAHLLFRTSGIDVLNDNIVPGIEFNQGKIEALCNKFAAELLLPEEVLNQYVDGKKADEAKAEEIASFFNVSREFIFRRFLDQGLIDQKSYVKHARKWAAQIKKKGSGNPYNNKITYLGLPYLELAFGKYHSNRITRDELADYVDTKPKHLSQLEHYVERALSK
jgi:Zn-dependent peptidase ImmA (M78 family)